MEDNNKIVGNYEKIKYDFGEITFLDDKNLIFPIAILDQNLKIKRENQNDYLEISNYYGSLYNIKIKTLELKKDEKKQENIEGNFIIYKDEKINKKIPFSFLFTLIPTDIIIYCIQYELECKDNVLKLNTSQLFFLEKQ